MPTTYENIPEQINVTLKSIPKITVPARYGIIAGEPQASSAKSAKIRFHIFNPLSNTPGWYTTIRIGSFKVDLGESALEIMRSMYKHSDGKLQENVFMVNAPISIRSRVGKGFVSLKYREGIEVYEKKTHKHGFIIGVDPYYVITAGGLIHNKLVMHSILIYPNGFDAFFELMVLGIGSITAYGYL